MTAVHLVGSVPLSSAEDVFRAAAEVFGSRLRRIPDGETGDRSGWVGCQVPILQSHPAFELTGVDGAQSDVDQVKRAEGDYSRPFFGLRSDADPDQLRFGDLGYAKAALESYRTFAKLKDSGVIAADVRFQVSLPTPMAALVMFVARRDHLRVEPAYRAALLSELEQICAEVPHNELAVQWDVAPELALLERLWESAFDDVEFEVAKRIVALGNAVPHDVELGFHLCYGDYGHQHFVQPKDTAVLVDLANRLAAGLRRPLNWLHLPVPRDRNDDEYFAPLRNLKLGPETELYLGLLHATDGLSGAESRIDAARRTVSNFGIGAECGLGRRPAETIRPFLELHEQVAAQL